MDKNHLKTKLFDRKNFKRSQLFLLPTTRGFLQWGSLI